MGDDACPACGSRPRTIIERLDDELDDALAAGDKLRALVEFERGRADGFQRRTREVMAERDRLRSALLDILVVESLESAQRLATGTLDMVPSELDDAITGADERDRLEAVVDAARRFVVADEAISAEGDAVDGRELDDHVALYVEWKRLRFELRGPVHALDASGEGPIDG